MRYKIKQTFKFSFNYELINLSKYQPLAKNFGEDWTQILGFKSLLLRQVSRCACCASCASNNHAFEFFHFCSELEFVKLVKKKNDHRYNFT